MKKIFGAFLCLLFLGFCACGQIASEKETATSTTLRTNSAKTTETIMTTVTTAIGIITSKDEPFADSIIDYIEKYIQKYEGQLYAFYDVDSDGKKELLEGGNYWNNLYLARVYTIQNSIAVRQEAFLSDPTMDLVALLYKNGTIRLEDTMNNRFTYYQFEGGELKFQIKLFNDSVEYYGILELNGPRTLIAKEEYDRLQKEMEGDGQVVDLDWKPLAEYGR